MDKMDMGQVDNVRRILVVDDDAGLRNLIARRLKKEGFETIDAIDGAEAVKSAISDPFAVLLIDQKLPDMQGSDVIRILSERGVRVPFVMMTGYGDERLAVEMMKLGAADYLVKDTGFIDLLPGVLDRVFRNIETEKRLKAAEKEKENLQAQLVQAQKIEAIGRLAGGIAHDFNNMLGVIIGHAELGLNFIENEHPLFSHLHDILKAAERSSDLTQQLLAFARKQSIAPKVLSINMAVDKMLKMLRRLIGENVELIWFPCDDPGMIRMDPSQIDQLLTNLCVNARDSISGTGRIIIETAIESFGEAYCSEHKEFVPGAYMMLSVSDNGCGMDKETLANIFEPFFTTKELGKGTGLGLATVYGIVKQNNGFINVYSEPGNGTTFRLYLPCHSLDECFSISGDDESKPLARGNETILLVEDEKMFLDVISDMLNQLGYKVLSSSSPNEAMMLARSYEDEIHLLITDAVMPEMNGYDLSVAMVDSHPGIKCLLMSGYTAGVISKQLNIDDGFLFINKPFTIKNLSEKIKACLESSC